MIATSKRRRPRARRPRTAKVISPAGSIGTPNSRFSPSAAPMNSATSVAMATTSPCTHMPQVAGRGSRSRTSSGSARPVTILGGGIMIIGGLVEVFLGIDAEGRSLEQVARPLTEVGPRGGTS